jgi:hypothetical protein
LVVRITEIAHRAHMSRSYLEGGSVLDLSWAYNVLVSRSQAYGRTRTVVPSGIVRGIKEAEGKDFIDENLDGSTHNPMICMSGTFNKLCYMMPFRYMDYLHSQGIYL